MGEKRRRIQGRERVLQDNPLCIYCGGPADTTDHCPPRCFFEERHWPEGYEFSACQACNQEAKADELLLGVLVRIRVLGGKSKVATREWEKLFGGLLNNQPEVVAEWQAGGSRNELRRTLRDKFGSAGDEMRRAGFGSLHMGPLTQAAVGRFMVKLGKALYWKHNGQLFDGVLYARHVSTLEQAFTPEVLDGMLHLAPEGMESRRNAKSLADQFIYRFNHSPQQGALYAVVRFSEQFIFQIIAVSAEMDARLLADRQLTGLEVLHGTVRHVCRLRPDG